MRCKKLYMKHSSLYENILNLFLYPVVSCYYTKYNSIKELQRIGLVLRQNGVAFVICYRYLCLNLYNFPPRLLDFVINNTLLPILYLWSDFVLFFFHIFFQCYRPYQSYIVPFYDLFLVHNNVSSKYRVTCRSFSHTFNCCTDSKDPQL